MTTKTNKQWTLLVFQWNPITAPLLALRDNKQHQRRTKPEGGPKPAKRYNSPRQPGWATVFFPVVYFPSCASSQQVFLLVFLFYSHPFCSRHPHFFSFTKKSLIPINLPTLNTSLLVACCLRGSICTVPGGILCQRLTGDAAAAAGSY